MFGASFFTPGASSSQPPPQKMPNAPASDHTNEESIVSLFQALRNQLGQDLRSITSNEIEVISIRWTFSRVTPRNPYRNVRHPFFGLSGAVPWFSCCVCLFGRCASALFVFGAAVFRLSF